jgi:O-antigen/teichoic acid export membrane protein
MENIMEVKHNIISNIKRIKGNKSLINGTLFSLFSFINRGFNFLLLIILANYITPDEYGYLGLYSSVVMVIGYFMALSTEGYVSNAYFCEGRSGVKNTMSCVFFTSVIVSILCLLFLVAFGDNISQILKLPLAILFLSVVICFFTVYTNVNLDYLRVEERIKEYGILSCSNAFLNFVISILFVKSLLMGWQGRVYAQSICFVLYGIIGLLFFTKKKLISWPKKDYWKMLLLYGLPIIPHLSANFIRQGLDRYIISYNHTISDVGLFSFALNLANVIVLIGAGFNQSNSVDIFKVLSDKNLSVDDKMSQIKRQKKQFALVYLVISIMVTVVGYFTIPFIVPKYAGAMNYFLCISVFGFLQCLYFLYTNFLFFYRKTKDIMYVTFGSSIVHLLLSLCLTRYSLYWTCLIYSITQGGVYYYIKKKAIKELKQNLYGNCN